MRQYWGYDDFRSFQKPVVQSILKGKDTFAILPTGGGKSICYQAPAILFPGITIVVSPLIALMNDQVEGLKKKGIEAIALHSSLSQAQIKEAESKVRLGLIKMVYVSPEKLTSQHFHDLVSSLEISLLAIDEAHCISQWGHDFRPSYREIESFQLAFRQIPILAVTATATPQVQEDIVKNLKMREPDCWVNSTIRTELKYQVIKTENKFSVLVEQIKSVEGGAIIVYARNRRTVAELSHQLCLRNVPALGYHAGMSNIQKLMNQNKWIGDEVKVMVATNAFGMGIDKPDVRKVIHYEPPLTLEEYVQEAGRAGRDRKESKAVILLGDHDIQKKSSDLQKAFPSIDQILNIHKSLKIEIPELHIEDFSIQQFAEAIKVPILTTFHTLNILDKWNIITLGKKLKHPSLVKVYLNQENKLVEFNESTQFIFRLLIKMYDGILYKKVKINENYVAAELSCSVSTLHASLKDLERAQLISYESAAGSTKLAINICESGKVENLLLKSNYLDLKEIAKGKLNAIEAYLTSESCRQVNIEKYFGGKGKDKACGKCDNCSNIQNQENGLQKESVLYNLLKGHINTVQELLLHYESMDKKLIIEFVEEWERQGIIELKGNVFNRL